MFDIDKLKFDEKGLIPAIVTDALTGEVLTLAYMNRQSLEISISEKRTCFWSRSRNCLWRKGETSGNVQHIVSMTADCDRDALTVKVIKDGPACHLGTESCFNEEVFRDEQAEIPEGFTLETLATLLKDRRDNPKEGSYTNYLFDKGIDKILKKVGEECTEVVVAGKGGDMDETVFEIADLTYHVMVLMTHMGISVEDVRCTLEKRHVIDKKVKQETMQ